jgi:hypothetical protein
VAVFADAGWQVRPDWRNVPLYAMADGAETKIEDIGVTPADIGATDQPRPSAAHRWINGGWTLDPLLVRQCLAAQRDAVLAELNTACEQALAQLRAGCPDTEVTSWAKQEAEARALGADPNVATPLLSAIARARGLPVADLATRVIAKADAYAHAAGALIGRRQALEDALLAIDLAAPDAAEQLAALVREHSGGLFNPLTRPVS